MVHLAPLRKVPLIPITECTLFSPVRGASGSDHGFKLEELWVEGGSIIIVLMIITRSLSSNLDFTVTNARGRFPTYHE